MTQNMTDWQNLELDVVDDEQFKSIMKSFAYGMGVLNIISHLAILHTISPNCCSNSVDS